MTSTHDDLDQQAKDAAAELDAVLSRCLPTGAFTISSYVMNSADAPFKRPRVTLGVDVDHVRALAELLMPDASPGTQTMDDAVRQ